VGLPQSSECECEVLRGRGPIAVPTRAERSRPHRRPDAQRAGPRMGCGASAPAREARGPLVAPKAAPAPPPRAGGASAAAAAAAAAPAPAAADADADARGFGSLLDQVASGELPAPVAVLPIYPARGPRASLAARSDGVAELRQARAAHRLTAPLPPGPVACGWPRARRSPLN
jgi:hypothetical protein